MTDAIVLNREQVRMVDRLAVERYGMTGLTLMENAGRGCADRLCDLGIDGQVVICCGKGNNAGDGFVIARILASRGHSAKVLLFCEPDELRGDAAENYQKLTQTSVPVVVFGPEFDDVRLAEELIDANWIVDAMLGTGARGEPRPPLDQAIQKLNAQNAKKMAIDLPSGLDCDTGQPASNTFHADHTFTFVATKPGFSAPDANQYVGTIHVIDIGVPQQLIDEILQLTDH